MYQQNPIDHARERTEEGEQPFKDAKEALRQSEADLRRQAAPDEGPGDTESEEERTARQEADAADRFDQIARETQGDPS